MINDHSTEKHIQGRGKERGREGEDGDNIHSHTLNMEKVEHSGYTHLKFAIRNCFVTGRKYFSVLSPSHSYLYYIHSRNMLPRVFIPGSYHKNTQTETIFFR